MTLLRIVDQYWPEITAAFTLLDAAIAVSFIIWILSVKKDQMSALAWCLTVLLVPFLGATLFLMFGYQHVHRPLKRKRRHRSSFRNLVKAAFTGTEDPVSVTIDPAWLEIARLATRLDAFSPTINNQIDFYSDGPPAYEAKFAAIADARHHIHLEYFIVQPDDAGRKFLALLADKAKQGVEVRLLFDAMGSPGMSRRLLRSLCDANGKCEAFLPLNPWRRRLQVNLRNHRKLLIVDGKVAFTGGLNLGNEYLGKSRQFGYWRDTHLRLQGPAVCDLQRVFIEDWHFASGELMQGAEYFPRPSNAGGSAVQIVASGPDQELNSIREIYFAAIMRARRRLWIASPYFVPDSGLLDALCLAARLGVDVRFLGQARPDKWLPYFAGRYYYTDVLNAGVRVFEFTKGMMHSKVILVDGSWASVGTANFDNRSLHLNFEVNCLLYDHALVAELEAVFEQDLQNANELDRAAFARRPFVSKLAENLCRLMSPVL